MTRRTRRHHALAFKARVALAAIKDEGTAGRVGSAACWRRPQACSVPLAEPPNRHLWPTSRHAKIGELTLESDFLSGARINTAPREPDRLACGRKAQPTAAVIDSQPARMTEAGGPRGYDGGKKISGRKRHILVDTQGNLLKAKVRPADIHDRRGAELLLAGLTSKFPHITLVWSL